MSTEVILLIIGGVLALPVGLFAAYLLSLPRARVLAIAGGLIGDVLVAAGIFYYIRTAHIGIDALSYFLGVLLGCSVGVLLGALVANFVVGIGSRGGSDVSSAEY